MALFAWLAVRQGAGRVIPGGAAAIDVGVLHAEGVRVAVGAAGLPVGGIGMAGASPSSSSSSSGGARDEAGSGVYTRLAPGR